MPAYFWALVNEGIVMWEKAVEWFVFDLLGLSEKSLLDKALAFFIGDYIKIIALLIVVIFVIAVIRSFIYPDRVKNLLHGKNEYAGNVMAATFGIFTPF